MKIVIGTMMLASLCAPAAWAQHGAAAGRGHHDMLRRGAEAMGFDQQRTTHNFLLYDDGGAIQVVARDAGDTASIEAVRRHLQEIARLFKAGDFSKPAHTHAREVPGTATMTRLKTRIEYRYEELPPGGRVHIATRDPEALQAIHAFLRFQIDDHKTGDPGRVIVR